MQAIAMLHPEGMAVAAAEEAREVQAAQQAAAAAARLKTPGISTRRTQLMSESPLTPPFTPSHALHRRPTTQRALFLMQMISR